MPCQELDVIDKSIAVIYLTWVGVCNHIWNMSIFIDNIRRFAVGFSFEAIIFNRKYAGKQNDKGKMFSIMPIDTCMQPGEITKQF